MTRPSVFATSTGTPMILACPPGISNVNARYCTAPVDVHTHSDHYLLNRDTVPRRDVRVEINWPCGLMDKALVFGTKDCRFESCQGHFACVLLCRIVINCVV